MQNTERVALSFERMAQDLRDTGSARHIPLAASLDMRAQQVRAGQAELDTARKIIEEA
jgi:hypothetical protein